jgi:hypothetical protein
VGSRVKPLGDSRAVGKSEDLPRIECPALASLRRVSRKPHVVVCEHRKKERL